MAVSIADQIAAGRLALWSGRSRGCLSDLTPGLRSRGTATARATTRRGSNFHEQNGRGAAVRACGVWPAQAKRRSNFAMSAAGVWLAETELLASRHIRITRTGF